MGASVVIGSTCAVGTALGNGTAVGGGVGGGAEVSCEPRVGERDRGPRDQHRADDPDPDPRRPPVLVAVEPRAVAIALEIDCLEIDGLEVDRLQIDRFEIDGLEIVGRHRFRTYGPRRATASAPAPEWRAAAAIRLPPRVTASAATGATKRPVTMRCTFNHVTLDVSIADPSAYVVPPEHGSLAVCTSEIEAGAVVGDRDRVPPPDPEVPRLSALVVHRDRGSYDRNVSDRRRLQESAPSRR